MAEAILNIKNLSKSYLTIAGINQIILEDVNLHIELDENFGSFFSILAPIGSGKTTLSKIIAGFESFEGEFSFNAKRIIESRGEIIYIPEKPSIFPWLNVAQNIALPIKLSKNNEGKQFNSNIGQLINLVGLSGYEDFYPNSTNSGFQLRMAIARALLFNPKLILLDDVLKNLDGETRIEIIELLKGLTVEKKVSFLLLTTNILEAILLSKKIFLMCGNPGNIFKQIELPTSLNSDNSEIITKFKNEIEAAFKVHGMFHSVLVFM